MGVVVAETPTLAVYASHLVEIEYEDLPAILTVEDAIKVRPALVVEILQCKFFFIFTFDILIF